MNWPDWSGETAVIVGTGPSVADVDLEAARGRAKVFVIKSEWKFAPWADALYGIDVQWWIANQGARGFKGLKFSPSPTVCRAYQINQVELRRGTSILLGKTGLISCGQKDGGGHSGWQAINLAVQFGAKRIVLVGFDMTLKRGARRIAHEAGVAKPDAKRIEVWRAAMDAAAPQFEAIGIEVINASPGSALTAYRKMDFAAALGIGNHGVQGQDRPVEHQL